MSAESDCSRAIALGKSWLATCLAKHSSCAQKARHAHIFCSDNSHFITDLEGNSLVPSRLLRFSIKPPTKHDQDIVNLVLSSDLDENTQYAALSHCWGPLENKPLQTLSENLVSRVEDGVEFEELPTTFRDAIEITRGMGYSHLWIDSLCIVQDSPEDWKREARRMAIIYDNAVFTIAAMDAMDSSQGLFPANGKVNGLEARAWTCQERMVAPRTMNFTRQSVTWECRQGHATPEIQNFTDGADDFSASHGDKDWIPPTQPKAIFDFFRDWRLPPKEEKDKDGPISRLVVMVSNALPEEIRVDDNAPSLETNDANSGTELLLRNGANVTMAPVQEAPGQLETLQVEIAEESEQNLRPKEVLKAEPVSLSQEIDKYSQGSAEMNTLNHEDIPPFVWSEGSKADGPVKIWNIRPPLGESGIWVDHDSDTVFTFIGNDLKAHAAHLASQTDYPIQDQRWTMQFDEPLGEKIDPFGQFQVCVRDLMRPKEAYYPFLRVWWNFLALYTPRSLTFDSDAFLAINRITSVAQRWTHLRNAFGLWLNFFEIELCWYIELEFPATRPRTPHWLAPSWSWASTRQGQVINAVYRLWPATPDLLIKPEIHVSVGTAFDMPLPFTAWRKSRYHDLEVKGSLRKASIGRKRTHSGDDEFEIEVEPHSRRSDYEVYKFYPDVVQEFTLEEKVHVWILPIWHFDGNDRSCELGHHLDVMLVLRVVWEDYWLGHYNTETLPEDIAADERTMRRIGLLEATYDLDQERDGDAIYEEWLWKYVRIL